MALPNTVAAANAQASSAFRIFRFMIVRPWMEYGRVLETVRLATPDPSGWT